MLIETGGLMVFLTASPCATAPAYFIRPRTNAAAWRDGMLVNLFNPKIIVFIFAFLPPFFRPGNGSALAQLLILGLIFKLGGTLINFAVAVFSSRSVSFFSCNVKIARGLTLLSAALYLVLAARMLFDRR